MAATLDDKDRRLFFEILFETLPEGTWEDAESCLGFLRHRPVAQELTDLQRQIEANPAAEELKRLVIRTDGTAATAVARAGAGTGQNPSRAVTYGGIVDAGTGDIVYS